MSQGAGPDLFGILWLAFWIVFAVQAAWRFRKALGMPPEWEPPLRQAWPFHIQRDTYLVLCAAQVIVALVCAAIALSILL